LRIDRPAGDGPWPLLLYLSGGGFIGYVPFAPTCPAFADAANAVIVTVAYRLAPMHTFPAAHDDCLAALQYCFEHGKALGGIPGWVGLIGDSAGGTLAAALTMMAKPMGMPPVRFQFLAYPMTAGASDTASRREFPAALPVMLDGWRAYAGDSGAEINPLLAPLVAEPLTGLPPALIVTAEHDPLRDEGELYGSRLAKAGVAATVIRYPGAAHGFLTSNKYPAARNNALKQLGEAVRRSCNAAGEDRR
jgi:acetyl esterase